jgi:uncharacterized protein YjbJ (UPF0337 family)
MNSDRIEGNWKQLKGKVKEKWGKLTDSDLDVIDGRREQLLGKLQERYGIAREEADHQLKEFDITCRQTGPPPQSGRASG